MTAEIIQFIPRPNPNWRRVNDEPIEYAIEQGPCGDEFVKDSNGYCVSRPSDCGNIGHPWPGEDKA
jgi:hypothetical protein